MKYRRLNLGRRCEYPPQLAHGYASPIRYRRLNLGHHCEYPQRLADGEIPPVEFRLPRRVSPAVPPKEAPAKTIVMIVAPLAECGCVPSALLRPERRAGLLFVCLDLV